MISVIGTGSYGKVFLVRRRDSTGQLYAMKVLKKKFIEDHKQVEHTYSERRILEKV
jgi:serine/threonine protein kinase